MIWFGLSPQSSPHFSLNYISHHADGRRVVVRAVCPVKAQAEIMRDFLRFDIEIVEDFDVIADKADRRYDGVTTSLGGEFMERVGDVGYEPGIGGVAAAALVRDAPIRPAEFVCDHPRAGMQLIDIG